MTNASGAATSALSSPENTSAPGAEAPDADSTTLRRPGSGRNLSGIDM